MEATEANQYKPCSLQKNTISTGNKNIEIDDKWINSNITLSLNSQISKSNISGKNEKENELKKYPSLKSLKNYTTKEVNNLMDSKKISTDNIYQFKELKDPTTGVRYKVGKLLGKGGFARCFEIVHPGTNEKFACKVIHRNTIKTDNQLLKIKNEVSLHNSMCHRHVVRFHNYFSDDNYVYIVLELCTKKSLNNLMRSKGRLSESEAKYYIRQIISGCRYIHANLVIHRDLKLANMLLNEQMQVKIADFGLATRMKSENDVKLSVCGTPNYIAPECLLKKGHTTKADVWSIGCILFALLTGKPPFETHSLRETYQRITTNKYHIPSYISSKCANLIKNLLNPNQNSRPSLEDALNDPFFTNVRNVRDIFSTFEREKPVSQDAAKVHRRMSTESGFASISESNKSSFNSNQKNNTKSKSTDNMNNFCKLDNMNVRNSKTPSIGSNRDTSNLTAGEYENIKGTYIKDEYCQVNANLQVLNNQLEQLFKSIQYNEDENKNNVKIPSLFYISKWVDYSNRYGFGYELNDGSMGVYFNDDTSVLKTTTESEDDAYFYKSFTDISNPLNKKFFIRPLASKDTINNLSKVKIVNYFKKYMQENLMSEHEKLNLSYKSTQLFNTLEYKLYEKLIISLNLKLPPGSPVWLEYWKRTEEFIIFFLSDKTVQINFFSDHTKIIMRPKLNDEYIILFIDRSLKGVKPYISTYSLRRLKYMGCPKFLANRLNRVKTFISNRLALADDDV